MRKTALERFSEKYRVDQTTGCWEWTAFRNPNGYGDFNLGRVGEKEAPEKKAHRASYILHKGPIPPGRVVMHKCDNPGCVNPDHLRIGTYSENVLDSISKGRNAFVGGEKNGHSKLTDAAVREIRKSTEVQSVLARRFGVNQSQISRAKTAKRWRHLA